MKKDILKEWKQKILSVIPDTYKGKFSKGYERKLIIRPKEGSGELVLAWESGERHTVYIRNLMVSRKDRNKGVGSELLSIAVNVCRSSKRSWLSVYGVLSETQEEWLLKNGFEVDDELYCLEEDIPMYMFGDDSWMDYASPERLYKLKVDNYPVKKTADYGTSH